VPVFGNLLFGENRTVKELLDLMLFYSSNDAAYALAELMGESEFVDAMNRTAHKIGLSNTEFSILPDWIWTMGGPIFPRRGICSRFPRIF